MRIEDTPPIYININIDAELKNKIKKWDNNGTFYAVFPTVGDSMTCNDTEKSIPHGSKVFVSEIKYKHPIEIPIRKPLVIELKGNRFKDKYICKTFSFFDCVNNVARLTSYNPTLKDRYISINDIGRVFEIHKVFKD